MKTAATKRLEVSELAVLARSESTVTVVLALPKPGNDWVTAR
jgi:hypothetical protein